MRQKGFTLIELIIVIIILGILAVTVAPKFIDISRDARIASLKGAQGAIKSAMKLFYAKALILGVDNKSAALTIGGVEYWNLYGYPHVTNTSVDRPGIINLAGIEADGYDLLYETVTGHGGIARVKVTPKGAPDNSTCYVSYLQTLSPGTPPVIGSDFSGC